MRISTTLTIILTALIAINGYATEPSAFWVSADQYHTSDTNIEEIGAMNAVAWRGERVSTQILFVTPDGCQDVECSVSKFRSKRATLPASIVEIRIVGHTIADAPNKDTTMVGDILKEYNHFSTTPESAQPLWLTISVPHNAKPDIYTAEVVISYDRNSEIRLPLTLEVQPYTLATPDQWNYHLDLWQHPSAVARAEELELWSDAHFEALKRDMTLLANAGQKVVTATLNKDP